MFEYMTGENSEETMMRASRSLTTVIAYVVIICGIFLPIPANADQTEYHFDYVNGSNDNDGTKAKPWKTLSKLEGLSLNPGDKVLFARGASFHGGVAIESSGTKEAPIVLTSYGDEGHMPKFTNTDPRHLNGNVFLIKGSYVIVDGLYFHNGPAAARGLSAARKMGAVFVERSAEHTVVRNCEIYDYPVGIQSLGEHCLITKNYIHDCTGFLQYPGWGPVGIMVAASHQEISYNRIENYVATGGSWGSDGGAIEIDSDEMHLRENIEIHHNISVGNQGFLEITKGADKSDPRDIRVHHNISDDFQQFILFWGGNDCVVEHNTVLARRSRNSNVHVVFTFPKNWLENIRIRNNIFAVANGLQAFGGASPYSESDYDQPRDHNLYFSLDGSVEDPCGLELGVGDIVADPGFLDIDKLDLRLRPDSPAIDAAARTEHSRDFRDNPRIKGDAPDIGAFEQEN
jgi:hypothetical protein